MLQLLALLAIVGGAALVAQRLGLFELADGDRLRETLDAVRELRALPALFLVVYVIVASVGLPSSPMSLAGGAIFGFAFGSVLNWMGAFLGALGAYALGRALGANAVRRILRRHASVLDTVTRHADFLSILRLRLLPVVPFNGLNYAAGIARVPARTFALATGLGIIPATLIFTWFADALVSGVTGASRRALIHVAIAGALLIAISFAPALVRRMQQRRSRRSRGQSR
ncbi:MAG TPA: VTT domain-containing protein [Gemmatimonadaceae bacterium]|nr:VTT domain-containing protein [Gemmatimonadaceae bacterium]